MAWGLPACEGKDFAALEIVLDFNELGSAVVTHEGTTCGIAGRVGACEGKDFAWGELAFRFAPVPVAWLSRQM